jgi:hypothetical protein
MGSLVNRCRWQSRQSISIKRKLRADTADSATNEPLDNSQGALAVNCKLAGTGNYYVHAVEFARELELPMERALMITALAGGSP